ncbi:hypothetical protein GCM10011369_03100 [Neiella marina]|uniref:Transporter substrate-binding domain-containing protein n=1 Tax=Neiella marina TaxID=508461 RepID=A0A8J2U234_9GAMM|nr:diguanylate cyclase [Neiella marina]GGA65063.1 hypothetical protein GCM10011369_03100 [Neiella marina]
MKNIITTLIMLSTVLLWPMLAHAELNVRYYEPRNKKDKYPIDLVEFLLTKAGARYTLDPVTASDSTEMRQIADLNAGYISISTLAANDNLNKELHAIQYPIFRGLLGHRVFIIRKGDQTRFNDIENIQQLSKLIGGQGRFWADTAVLKSAGLQLETPVKYDSLFYMLDGNRFDYFPRAIHEPLTEIAARPHLDLTIENNILLVYPQPMLFYTAKSNTELSRALEQGFELAVKDGSFASWFINHPMIEEVMSKIDLDSRTVIRIPNPHLPAETPVDRAELWLDVTQLKQAS